NVKRTGRTRTRRTEADQETFLFETGNTSAGKSHEIRPLEDLGYFCFDNLQLALLTTFASLTAHVQQRADRRAAVVIAVREGASLTQFPGVYRRLQRQLGSRVRLLFLEASDAALLRRFSETRRPHPLAGARSVAVGLSRERQLLEPIRRLVDRVIDTTELNVHELRKRMQEAADGS